MAAEIPVIREHIRSVIKEHMDRNEDRRDEALREFFSVTMPGMDETSVDKVAAMVPVVEPGLYDKWIDMFLESIFKTVPMEQLELLSDGSEDNNAALVLVYIMFLESERMEKQIDEDLRAYALEHSQDEDMGAAVAAYIRAKAQQLGHNIKK